MLLCGQPGCLQSIKAEALLKCYKKSTLLQTVREIRYFQGQIKKFLFGLEYIKYISLEKEAAGLSCKNPKHLRLLKFL